jgi:PKHD-type hydroxylase
VLPNKFHPPMFNRYGDGMHFGTHVDGSVRMIPGSPHKLRTDLSATLFLVEPQNYDGGELVLESDFGSQSAKFAAGDLIVYSSTLRHRVTAITRSGRSCSNSTAPSSA